MLYNITLYLITAINPIHIAVEERSNYLLYSHVPITDCTAVIERDDVTHQKKVIHICSTEKIYAAMTGQDTITIITEGAYVI